MGFLARIGYGFVSMLARCLPSRLSYLLGETLAAIFFVLSGGRRRVIARNLATALGQEQAPFGRTGLAVMLN